MVSIMVAERMVSGNVLETATTRSMKYAIKDVETAPTQESILKWIVGILWIITLLKR